MTAVCGVDAGGTKTAVAVADPGRGLLAETYGPGILLEASGGRATVEALALAVTQAVEASGAGAVDAVVVGWAGADTQARAAAAERALREVLAGREVVRAAAGGPATVRVVNDAAVALEAATGARPAAVLLAGTGSIAYGEDGAGRGVRAGGWGHVLGDEGSGYDLARSAVAGLLTAVDEGGHGGALLASLLEHFGLREAGELVDLATLFAREPGRAAAAAPAVLAAADAGDPLAARVVEEAAGALARLARRLLDRMAPPPAVLWLGGSLLRERPDLAAAVTARAGIATATSPLAPVTGALLLACRTAAGGEAAARLRERLAGEPQRRPAGAGDRATVPATAQTATGQDSTGPGAMASEMAEQPRVLADLAARRGSILQELRARLPEPLLGSVLVARGSSDNAAVLGRYVLELASGRPAALAAPSLHTLYGARTDHRGHLAVAFSQSGATPEIVAVTERLRDAGAVTIAVTNDPASPLASAADVTVALGAGEERAVPSTKTLTAQLAAAALVAEATGEVPWSEADWERLPGAVTAVLDDHGSAARAASLLAGASGLVLAGRGLMYPVALEAALKVKETTAVQAEGYSAADLRHGPIAILRRGLPVVAIGYPGPGEADVADLTRDLRRRGVTVLWCGPGAGAHLPLPGTLAEALATVPATVRMQQLALALARRLGVDPDAPPGLSKVTMT